MLCRVRQSRQESKNMKGCDEVFGKLIQEGTHPDDLFTAVSNQVRSAAKRWNINHLDVFRWPIKLVNMLCMLEQQPQRSICTH